MKPLEAPVLEWKSSRSKHSIATRKKRPGVSSIALPVICSIGWPLRHCPAAFIEDRRSGRRRRRRAPAGARQWILGIERQLRRRADLTGSLGMSWKWASVETSRRHSAPAAQQCGSSPRHAALTSSSSMCRRRAGPQHGASHARRGEQALAPRVASRAPSRLATGARDVAFERLGPVGRMPKHHFHERAPGSSEPPSTPDN